MSLTQLTASLNTIQGLSDTPNSSDGVTADVLKAYFDQDSGTIKTYINDTLLAELGAITDGSSGADNIGATKVGTGSSETVQGILEEINDKIVTTTGDVTGPSSAVSGNIPIFNGISGKEITDGYGVSTVIATPGVDTKLATEKAVRDAVSAAGGGDFSTSTSSVTDGHIIVFDGTGGKTGKSSSVAVSAVMQNLSEDTSPQLGGDLDTNGKPIIHTLYDNGSSGTAKTIDWGNGNHQKISMTANCTYTFTAPAKPTVMSLRISYTGAYDVTFPATVLWSGSTAPTLTKTTGRVDILTFVYDGTNYFGGYNLNYTV